MNNLDVYQKVTDAILARLDKGEVPWRKSWTGRGLAGAPRNFVSKKPYRGSNIWLLSQGYESPFWLTFNQAKGIGAKVRKGEKASIVVFWSILNGKVKPGEEPKKVYFLRYYNVFNVAQCDDIDPAKIAALREEVGIDGGDKTPEFTPIQEAARILDGFADCPKIEYGGDRAFYSPALDYIGLPKPTDFKTPENFYCTAFHECAHSTGHASRLNRDGVAKDGGRFGSEPYAKEELVAEFAATYLSALAGIEQPLLDNAAAYIANWSRKLKDDPKLFVSAASQAQRAAEYILKEEEETHEGEEVAGELAKA